MGSHLNFKNMGQGSSGSGRPLTRQSSVESMDMDECLKNLWTAEETQVMGTGGVPAGGNNLQRTKTVDEVWKELFKENSEIVNGEMTLEEFLLRAGVVREEPQVIATNGGSNLPQRQQTLGEMTLEEFLLRAGVVREEAQVLAAEQQNNGPQRQQTLGEMTLEEFLVRAGVVREEAQVVAVQQQNNGGCFSDLLPNNSNPGLSLGFGQPSQNNGILTNLRPGGNNNIATTQSPNLAIIANRFGSTYLQQQPQQQRQQQQHHQQQQRQQRQQQLFPKQPTIPYASPLHITNGQLASPGTRGTIMGIANPTMTSGLVQGGGLQGGVMGMAGVGGGAVTVASGSPANQLSDVLGKSNGDLSLVSPVPYAFNGSLRGKVVERRQRRMITNKESAARSGAHKQADTMELEAELAKLRQQTEELQKKQAEMIEMQKNMAVDNDIVPPKLIPYYDESLPGESFLEGAEDSKQRKFGSRQPSKNSQVDLKRDGIKGHMADEIQKKLKGLKIDSHRNIDVKDNLNEEVIETVRIVDVLKGSNGSSSSVEMSLDELERKKIQRYSCGDLTSITKKFTNQVGSGAYGDVFKGILPNGVQVAVKKLKDTAMNVMESTFIAEVRTMSSTSHRHLVRLYGYCFEANMKALVYEYLENGSLDKVLYENHLNLCWEKLYNIAIGIAKGLSYLHESCDDQIVHYDVKPSNVLLDSKLSPKVADFGMAKIAHKDLSHISLIEFRGTRPYAAPEMWMQMAVTPKSDVYSFGMMLFEVLGRKKNVDGQTWLPGQVWEKFKKGQLDEMIEYCGIEDKDKVKAKTLSTTALWCTQYKPDDRPMMSDVVQVLKGNIQLPSPPDPFYPYSISSGASSSGGGSTKNSGHTH